MKINILDSNVYNRISAGEVVEKPASIVKELIENSLDAKADNIEIEIKNGGIDYISVSDNGIGIEATEIKKVFLPHATSKIKEIDDLDKIISLGFRGEAMSSIASVARVNLFSKTQESVSGNTISVAGGKFDFEKPYSMNNGTIVVVENLFYNTPARAKFLRKPKSEEAEITQLISRFILANPNISFKYIADDEIIFHHKTGDLLSAISCVYGFDFSSNLVKVNYEKKDIVINGYVSKIGFSKPNTTYQTTIINGRYVVDELVSKAVYNAFEDYLMTRQFPVFILNINMPYEMVDINVHPTKLNVKFSSPNELFADVYSAVRDAIFVETKSEQINNNIIKDEPINILEKISNNEGKSFDNTNDNKVEEVIINYETPIKFDTEIKFESSYKPDYIQSEIKTPDNMNIISDNYKVIGEIFNTYLAIEQGENLILLDIHACHERLNFDRFMKMLDEKFVSVQQLLLPYIFNVNPQEMDFLLSIQNELFKMGFEIEQFGKNEIRLSAVPVLFKDLNLKKFIDDILNDLKYFNQKKPYEIKNYVAKKACKNSVKAGDILNNNEISSLIFDLKNSKTVMLCPHGRPISYTIHKSTFDKWFKRIV